MTGAVLVTGGNGFLGRYVCSSLARAGRPVVSYDIARAGEEARFVFAGSADRIAYANGQVTDLSRVLAVCQQHRVRNIVHTAGFVEVEGAADQPSFTYQVNTFGSIVMFEAARLLGLGRLVLISSNGVYQAREREPIDESHPVFSASSGSLAGHYGASKLASEIIGLTYADQNGLDLVVLRASSIYGFGMQRPLYVKPFVESAVVQRSCHLPGGAEMPRDYTYVTDAADAVVRALEARQEHLAQRVFNVSGGRTHTAGEVVELVRELVPGADISIASGLTQSERRDMRARGRLDTSRASALLGYRPRYDLRAGLADYIAMLREFLELKRTDGTHPSRNREESHDQRKVHTPRL